MLNKIRRLKTNENILIAIHALHMSKSTFLSIFLMTYTLRISATEVPTIYVLYQLFTYVVMGIAAILLMKFMKSKPLLAWRLSMLFSVLNVLIVFTIQDFLWISPFILALTHGIEANLYHRPNVFLAITEVKKERWFRFQGTKHIVLKIISLISPFILGVLITERGFTNSIYFIAGISLTQLLISILFRPTAHHFTKPHSLKTVKAQFKKHPDLRRVLKIAFFRGLLITNTALIVIATLFVYSSQNSDFNLGLYTSIAAIISLPFFLTLSRTKNFNIPLFLAIFAITISSISIYYISKNPIFAIIFYISITGLLQGVANMFMGASSQRLIRTKIDHPTYALEVEAFSEVYLNAGRVISFILLFATMTLLGMDYLPLFAILQLIFFMPAIYLTNRSSIKKQLKS